MVGVSVETVWWVGGSVGRWSVVLIKPVLLKVIDKNKIFGESFCK